MSNTEMLAIFVTALTALNCLAWIVVFKIVKLDFRTHITDVEYFAKAVQMYFECEKKLNSLNKIIDKDEDVIK